MQTLSSKYTYFYKFVLIMIWIIGFAAGVRKVLFSSPFFDSQWMQYTGTWLGIALFIYFATGSIKQVQIHRDKKCLEVSNFFKTLTIGFEEIEDIDGSSFLSPKLVWFSLKKSSGFGKKIAFMPATRPTRGIGKHPMVIDLRREFKLDS